MTPDFGSNPRRRLTQAEFEQEAARARVEIVAADQIDGESV